MTSPLSVYNGVRSGLKSIFRSRLQMQILLSLEEGCKTLSDLREVTGSSSQALLPRIRALEKRYFISAREYQYCLTPLGRLLETKIAEFMRLLSVLTEKDTFWKDHLIEAIPEPFLSEMSELGDSQIIADTSVEVFRVYSSYLDILEHAKRIHWILPVANPGQIRIMARKITEGTPVEMIVTVDVASQLLVEPYVSILKGVRALPGFRILVLNRELKLGIIVTEKDLMLGLYTGDGLRFDVSSQFRSSDPRSLAWGEGLFAHIREHATPLPA